MDGRDDLNGGFAMIDLKLASADSTVAVLSPDASVKNADKALKAWEQYTVFADAEAVQNARRIGSNAYFQRIAEAYSTLELKVTNFQRLDTSKLSGSMAPVSVVQELLAADLEDGDAAAAVDPFDQVQLAEVIRTCRASPSLSAAGRSLFSVSRERRTTRNDADRLKKYLARFGLDWAAVSG